MNDIHSETLLKFITPVSRPVRSEEVYALDAAYEVDNIKRQLVDALTTMERRFASACRDLKQGYSFSDPTGSSYLHDITTLSGRLAAAQINLARLVELAIGREKHKEYRKAVDQTYTQNTNQEA